MKVRDILSAQILPLVMVISVTLLSIGEISATDINTDLPYYAKESESLLCSPLDPAKGSLVNVFTVAELQAAVNSAASGDTILVAEGTYYLNGGYLRIDVPNVTLRSASGLRDSVILDGNYITTEIIQIAASNVTIADLTLREAYYHPIHVMSTPVDDAKNSSIYNVHIVDPGEQAIKINPASAGRFPDAGTIACSHIELTDSGRPHIRNNCYTGGIDAHQARGWVIRDNLIEGFWCQNGLSEHAIHFWRGSRDTLVERNRISDNARGIGFGLAASGTARTYADNPCPGAGGGYVDHYGGIIRNNFVFAGREALFAADFGYDCGICLWQACRAQVFHNSVASTEPPFSSIEWRFDHTEVEIKNNLMSHNLRDRGGSAVLDKNVENSPMNVFVDSPSGDLHLLSGATSLIDQGIPLNDISDDIDGEGRPIGPGPDIGADEFGMLITKAVNDLRVASAINQGGILNVTLTWTAPTKAITISLRYDDQPINESSWGSAPLLASSLSGNAESYSGPLQYIGGIVYFTLKSQNSEGAWSGLSNNAFWPIQSSYLPVFLKR